jgi:methionyl-tRNA formyltransferase
MELKKDRIVIWCGTAPNQKALVNKMAALYNVVGLVIDEHKTSGKRKSIVSVLKSIIDRIRFNSIYGAWKKLMGFYNKEFPNWPEMPVLKVPNINGNEVYAFTIENKPDLIIVSGTALVKEPLVSMPVSIGIINLHTGLSPYVKGGPNCTNWCIANNEWFFVGNTIMWLNAGIDSGNIITTEQREITSASSLYEAHYMVMEHAHDLYIRAVRYLLSSKKDSYNSVAQKDIDKGKLYLTKMWTPAQRKRLLLNWRKRKKQDSFPLVRTIPLLE